LRGQKEELEHRAERPAELVATDPKEADLVVGERSIARCFLNDFPHTGGWVGDD
jgi:hypothetical protein